jgi:hypothetical protein
LVSSVCMPLFLEPTLAAKAEICNY